MQHRDIKQPEENDMSLKRIGENLAFLMRKSDIDSNRLSLETGIGIATINNLRKGIGNPTISTLSSIADFFQVKIGDLIDHDLKINSKTTNNIKSIPLINYSNIERFLSKKTDFTERYKTEVDDINDESLFAVEITNNSLAPELDRGTICVISLKEQFCDGDIVLVKLKNYPLCLRRVFVSDVDLQFSTISLELDSTPKYHDKYEIVGVLLKIVKRLK